jgi:hypothetical protein
MPSGDGLQEMPPAIAPASASSITPSDLSSADEPMPRDDEVEDDN